MSAGRLTATIEALLGRVAVTAHRRPWATLALVLAMSASALFGARQLRLDPDLVRLLPESFASVQDLHALEARAGAIGYVVAVIEGGQPEARHRYAEHLATQLEALDTIRYVDVKRPVDWFADHGLYFLSLQDLETVRARLAARQKYEKQRANPMYLDLEEAAPPSVDFSDIEARYRGERGAQSNSWLNAITGSAYYEDLDAKMLVVLARPAHRSSDMDFAQHVISDTEAVLAANPGDAFGAGMTVNITGRYKKKIDQKAQIQSDLALASSLAFALSLLYLLVHFRRPRAVAFVAMPLITGLLWTFGFAGFAFGTLNLLTGFIGAILLGLGVDHGIHLMSRFDAERANGRSIGEAVEATFSQTGRAVFVAALTTAVAFAGLAWSEFRAFREFGIIAAAGMVSVVLAYTLCLPALLTLARRQAPAVAPTPDRPRRRPTRALAIAGVLMLGVLSQFGSLRFDYDFAALEDASLASFRLDHEVNRILGYSQTPVLFLTDDPQQEAASTQALRQLIERTGDRTIDFVLTLGDLIPAEQAAKFEQITRIGTILKRVKPSWLEDDAQRDGRTRLIEMAQQPPFTAADLPPSVLRQFSGPGDPTATQRFVLVFPAIALTDGARVPQFAQQMRTAAALPAGRLPVAGETMVLADILNMVKREAIPVLSLTVGLVMLTLLLLLGAIRPALIAAATGFITLALTLSLAGMMGLRLNYLNIVMIPVLFGIAVDGAVHLVTRVDQLTETARAIAGAVLTTLLGFGALLLADHPGLQSLGALAVLGLAVNALVCLVVVPAALVRFMRPQTRSAS
jgi:hypothetical protein